MIAAAVGLSHSPLIGKNDPAAEVLDRVDIAITKARDFVRDFDPEVVVLFAPDHYNGFFYKEMPPFCLATEATAVGDFGSAAGPLSVDTAVAGRLAELVLEQGVDLTISARMTVDHGFVQPLEVLFGGIDEVPVVPIFVNGVATPLCPVHRIRALGAAIGTAAMTLDKRVLFLGSGGLSHDPPVPVLQGAPPRVANALIEGHPPTAEQRLRGEERVVQAGRDYAAGSTAMVPINPQWDNAFLDILDAGTLTEFDTWRADDMAQEAGNSVHEVRTWIAAFASLSAAGPYSISSRFYESIPEWIAGFAVVTAQQASSEINSPRR